MTTLVRKDAASTRGGEVTAGAQDIAGDKNLLGAITIAGALIANGGVRSPLFQTANYPFVTGTINIGTMLAGEIWLVSVAGANYGTTDNRGGLFVVMFTGPSTGGQRVFVIDRFTTVTQVSIDTAGVVSVTNGGGSPVTTVRVMKIGAL